MGRKRSTDGAATRLFSDKQPSMFEKSYEERLCEQQNQPVECLGMSFANDEERRNHFLGILREKLKDPAFRETEGFPIGQEGFIPGMEPKAVPIVRGKKMKIIRLEAVRAGFKYCWQNRDYRTIIAVAQRIPENVLQEDPKLLMWYDQAMTRSGEE